ASFLRLSSYWATRLDSYVPDAPRFTSDSVASYVLKAVALQYASPPTGGDTFTGALIPNAQLFARSYTRIDSAVVAIRSIREVLRTATAEQQRALRAQLVTELAGIGLASLEPLGIAPEQARKLSAI